MHVIRWIVAVPVAVAVIALAVANRAPVPVSLDPLPFVVEIPLFAVFFGALLLGFAAGAAFVWVAGFKWRMLARNRGNRVDFLERELKRASQPPDRSTSTASSQLPTAIDTR